MADPSVEQLYQAMLYLRDQNRNIVNPASKEGQDQIRAAINQATAGTATEATLALAQAGIDALVAKDGATSAKQDALKVVVDSLDTKDYSTETTLAALKAVVDTISTTAAERATEATAQAILARLDQELPVSINGKNDTIKSAPVTGAKTITSTAAEVFAGASRLANRYQMVIQNVDTLIIYIGPAGVTTAGGFPLLPGDSITFSFKADVATPIYAVSTGSCAVRVVELA